MFSASITSILPSRLRSLAPEAVSFGLIGVGNALLYFVIFNLTMSMGAVKATIIGTTITTTFAYVAHRYWTYRSRPRTAVRREYVLFAVFNIVGMLIQGSIVAFVKYGLDMSESVTRDRIWFNLATVAGMGLATAFRFWAYRTLVFRPNPADHAAPTTATEALAEAYEEASEEDAEFEQITNPLAVEIRQRRHEEINR